MIDLIIFDCDGVLIDSEIIGCKEFAKALCEDGFNISYKDVITRFIGMSKNEITKIIEDENNKKLSEGFYERLSKKQNEAFVKKLTPIKGVEKFISKSNIKYCLASGSSIDRLVLTMKISGMDKFFNKKNMFSSDFVEKGKPAPDIFLHASEKMNADIKKTLVIEDSLNGIKAAKRAGAKVFGFYGGSHCYDGYKDKLMELNPDELFDDFSNLENMISNMEV